MVKRFTLLALAWACGLWAFGLALGNSDPAQELFKEGMRASMQRDWKGAIDGYTKAIAANGRHVDAYMERAAMYQITDRVDEAIMDYQRVLELKPGHYHALERLAGAYEKKGEYSKAVECYGKALEQVKDSKWRSIINTWRDHALEKMKTGR